METMYRSTNKIKVRLTNVIYVKVGSKIVSGDIHVSIIMVIWLTLFMMCTCFAYL